MQAPFSDFRFRASFGLRILDFGFVKILIANLGSTSLKWRLFDCANGAVRLLHKGGFERVTEYAKAVEDCLGQLRDAGVNPHLDIFGVVMTMFDGRTRLAQQVVSEVREHFGERVFETLIPRSTRLAEAPSFGKPIIYYDKYSTGAAAYELLAQEFLVRLDR